MDSLGFDDLVCKERWCKSFTKFSNAHTPSVLTQASLTSLITAKYPFENYVWHNGEQFLSASVETLAEKALKEGFRTAFFSGGSPVFKKSGLQQGFEIFDDILNMSRAEIYIPYTKNFKNFFSWLEKEVGDNEKFLSFIYLPDLQFSEKKGNLISGLKTFTEKLLKKRPSGHFVILGLQGKGKPYDLKSNKTQVPLWFYTPEKAQTIKELVSLADAGKTFYELLALPPSSQSTFSELPIFSLKSLLTSKPSMSPEFSERKILIESSWTQWKQETMSRFALRQKDYLFLWDKKSKLFQNSRLIKNEKKEQEMRVFLKRLGVEPWSPPTAFPYLNTLSWKATKALEKNDWETLFQSSKSAWKLVGAKRLNRSFLIPVKGCLNLFFENKKNVSCDDSLLKKAISWSKEKKASQFQSFFKEYWYEKTYQKILKWNQKNHDQWDVRSVETPLMAELYLSLPRNKKLLRQVENEMKKLSFSP